MAEVDEFDAEADARLVSRLEEEVIALTGTGLDGLLNPMKLVNTERELIKLRAQLEAAAEGSEEAAALEAVIEEKEQVAFTEKRSAMKGWLRTVFRVQSYGAVLASGLVAYDALPFAGHLDIGVRVLGFWAWWLFIIPSLRSIKPLAPEEKRALNFAFLAVLFVSVLAPVATKDTAVIWWLDAGAVGLCYALCYTVFKPAQAGAGAGDGGNAVSRAAKFVFRAIDFGSGLERGQRSAEKTALEERLEKTIAERAAAGVDVKPRGAKSPGSASEGSD